MNFNFGLFDKELESLNKQLEINGQHSNNVLSINDKEQHIIKSEIIKNNIVNTKNSESEEFIITEKKQIPVSKISDTTLLENKNDKVLSRREQKNIERLKRQENIRKEREEHFKNMNKQKEQQNPVIKETNKVLVDKSSTTHNIPTIDKQIQTKVNQIIEIENNFNSKLETINKDYKEEIIQKDKELNKKDEEIKKLREDLKQEHLRIKTINDRVEKELKKRLNKKLTKQKELDEVEKRRKDLDKLIKEQEIKLKNGSRMVGSKW